MIDNLQTLENSTSVRLSVLIDQLSFNQLRFIIALQDHKTKKAAAETIGVSAALVYTWPPEVDEAARLMVTDGLITARRLRRRALAKAMLVKIDGLDSGDEPIRQRAATEIIDWEMGRAEQKVKVDDVTRLTDADRIARIAMLLDTARERATGRIIDGHSRLPATRELQADTECP